MLCWMPKILVVDLLRVVFSRTPSYSVSLGLQEVDDRRIKLDLANVGADGVSFVVRICE